MVPEKYKIEISKNNNDYRKIIRKFFKVHFNNSEHLEMVHLSYIIFLAIFNTYKLEID